MEEVDDESEDDESVNEESVDDEIPPTPDIMTEISTPATEPETPFTSMPSVRRSGRARTQPIRLDYHQIEVEEVREQEWARLEQCHNISVEELSDYIHEEYTAERALVIAQLIHRLQQSAEINGAEILRCYGQQHSLGKGLKLFGKDGDKAAMSELHQMVKRVCFKPIKLSELSESEIKKIQRAMMLLSQKSNGIIKGRLVFNGKGSRDYYTREEAASPTATPESIMLVLAIDAKEGRDNLTGDVPNAFIQAHVPKIKDGEDRIIMKIDEILVDMLVELAPEIYSDFVVFEKGKKVLYVQVLKAIYGMLIAALLWYNQL